MPASRSAGIILFREASAGRQYLILRASRNEQAKEFWDIPKGELAPGEDGLQAAARETREETGIADFAIVPGFKFTARYFTRRDGRTMPKFVAVFLARTAGVEVRLSWEHDMFLWAPFGEARVRLSAMRPAIEAAEEFLNAQQT